MREIRFMALYPYLPPPVACESLEKIVGRWGGSMQLTETASSFEYPLPEHASVEVKDFLRPRASIRFAPAFLARLPAGRVFGSGNVLSPDGKSIARDVSPDFGKAFDEHWLLTYGKIPPAIEIPGRTAVIATTLGSGYSHWLLEELPRLLALKESKDCDAIVAHGGKSYAREAIVRSGFLGKIIEAKRNVLFACEELIVPGLGQMNRATVHALDEFGGLAPTVSSMFGEKIYVSRAGARRRRVVDEVVLSQALESRGFVSVQLETLTWAEQIAAFRGAKVIVAPHGAGLANLVFCECGTRVVELFRRDYVNGCYWQLAALKGLDYRPLVKAGDAPLAQVLSANRLDIEADVADVMKAIR